VTSYTVCYLMQVFHYHCLIGCVDGDVKQVLVMYFVIELLQRGSMLRSNDSLTQMDVLGDPDTHIEGVMDHDVHSPSKILINEGEHKSGHNSAHGVDLHYLGQKFLGKYSRVVFDVAVLLHLVTIMISYGLAGSEAYGQVFGVNYQYLILPFIVILTLVIIIGSPVLPSIISFLTFGKGTLLFLVVFVTGIVAEHVHQESTNNWIYTGRSFLIGTVALGGATNVIPVIFAKIPFTKQSMMKLMLAATLGLTTVYLLNIIWCYYLLRIIPQLPLTPGGVSLITTEKLGEIATIPLIIIIRDQYPQYTWIAVLVDIFIMVSITVSYITIGSGLKHVLDGISMAWRRLPRVANTVLGNFNRMLDRWEHSTILRSRAPRKPFLREPLLYVATFGLILSMALLNPKGFIAIMESGSSLGINLMAGVFVTIMLNHGRTQPALRRYPIPLPLPDFIYTLRFVVMYYFTFAVVYDIANILAKLISFVQ